MVNFNSHYVFLDLSWNFPPNSGCPGLTIFHAGGILFKVYIVGETVRVVRRFSLPDVSDYDMENNEGIFPFPRVSCATNNAEDADIDPCISGEASLLLH